MFTGSYPKPEAPWPIQFPVRNLEPLEPLPPLPSELPTVPCPPRKSLLHPEWTLSTHIVPAAYLRTTPLVPVPKIPSFTPGQNKKQRKAVIAALADEVAQMKFQQSKGELKHLGRDETVLWCCVNRYVRINGATVSGKRNLTLFLAHANGFSKEIWEPTLSSLVKEDASYEITEIWSFEAPSHGDSARMNDGKLSGVYDWQDNSRDIAQFLLYYLPSTASRSPLPLHLPTVPISETLSRQKKGFSHRTLVGIGHSFGGCSLGWVASHFPYKRLFDALIFVDPIIVGSRPDPGTMFAKFLNVKVTGALSRRDHWVSREEARRLFNSSPFFRSWNPAVLELYLECCMYEVPNGGGVKLKMEPIYEAITFAEQRSSCEAWFHLPHIDEDIELFFVMPSGNGEPGPPEMMKDRQYLTWRRPLNSTNVLNPNAGHLIPQETPNQLAEDIHRFLQHKYIVLKNKL